MSRSFGRSYFGCYIIISKVNAVIIRFRRFGFMTEPAGSIVFGKNQFTRYRHYRKLSVIIHPRRRLVCLLETANLFSSISITPSISHFSGLRCPKIHPPRSCNCWIGIPIGKTVYGLCSHYWIDIIYRIFSFTLCFCIKA